MLPAVDEIAVAVVGMHLAGMPLNGELLSLGARLLEATRTAADYQLFLLAAMEPPRPGLLRVEREGTAIETEIWAVPARAYGRFIAAMPAPLSIGTIRLGDGRTAQGFLVESAAVAGARDISSFGGWRAYLAKQPASV